MNRPIPIESGMAIRRARVAEYKVPKTRGVR
jgi:hypothetical protein